ncbi:MAG: hypothetical protein H6599_01270 [Flavobacteriales bacterium]|nr:hypothetical protein [Flavobacteriales bacterium]
MRLFTILLSIFVLLSCDCYRSYQGVVVDFETGIPLDSVRVYSAPNKKYLINMTSSSGTYQGQLLIGWRCTKPKYLLFTKEGYHDTLAVDSGELKMFKQEN